MKNLSLALLLTLLAAGSCKIGDDDPQEVVVLGAIYNLTGGQSALDIPSSRGAELAVNKLNAEGGVNGKLIALQLRDGQTDTTVLRNRVTEILVQSPSVLAFLGLSDTDQVLAAARVAADNHRVFLTSGATSPKLPGQIPEYLFLACFGDNVQAAAAAEWAYNSLNARTVSVVYDSTETYTQLLHAYFITRFEQLGGQVKVSVPYATGSVETALPAVQTADFIFLAALPDDAPDGVRKLRIAGFSAPIVGGDGFDAPELWANATDLSNVYFTTHAYLGADNANSTVKAFRDAYIEEYQEEPNAFAALGYDAVRLLAEAMRTAFKPTAEDVRTGLAGIQHFAGVTGDISFDATHIPKKSVTILEVDFGVQKYVTDILPEVVPEP